MAPASEDALGRVAKNRMKLTPCQPTSLRDLPQIARDRYLEHPLRSRWDGAVGWRSVGSSERRWQIPVCADVWIPSGCGGLGAFGRGGRWRVHATIAVSADAGSVKLVRRVLLVEGVVLARRLDFRSST